MGGDAEDSLLDRATASFRRAISQPAHEWRQAELLAEEAAASNAPDAPEAQVVALRGASWAARELFEHDAARGLIDRAVAIAQQHGLADRHSECLLTRSTIHLEHGRQPEARADLELAAELAPPEVGAEAAVSLGVIEQKAGTYLAALTAYKYALGLANPEQDDVRFKALSNGALCASRLGRRAEASRMIDDAVDVAERVSAVYLAHAAHNRAVLAAERDDLTAALAYFDEALELWLEADLIPAEHYLEKAETFLALRLLPEADAAVTSALRVLDGQPGGALLFSEGLLLAAVIAENRGEFDRAIELNEEAAATFAAQNRPGWWALAEHAAIAARLATGDISANDKPQLTLVEDELARSGHSTGRVAAALTAARLARTSGDLEHAAQAYQRCADLGQKVLHSSVFRAGWPRPNEPTWKETAGAFQARARAGLRTLAAYSVDLRCHRAAGTRSNLR